MYALRGAEPHVESIEPRPCPIIGMELAPQFERENIVRVVTIKHPPPALEGITADNFEVGQIFEVSPHIGILMIAAGWMRGDTRSRMRRQQDLSSELNRRAVADRRSAHES